MLDMSNFCDFYFRYLLIRDISNSSYGVLQSHGQNCTDENSNSICIKFTPYFVEIMRIFYTSKRRRYKLNNCYTVLRKKIRNTEYLIAEVSE